MLHVLMKILSYVSSKKRTEMFEGFKFCIFNPFTAVMLLENDH